MLQNVEPSINLQGFARACGRDYETQTVHPKLVDELTAKGWVVDKRNKSTVRLRRTKPHGKLLEDRVWSLLYRMGFGIMSGKGGGILHLDGKGELGAKTQIDVVALDAEIALAIETKSCEIPSRRPTFSEELGKHSLIRENFSQAIRKQFPVDHKRQAVLAFFVYNVILSENDRQRAADANVILLDERDLAYYEELVSHLGYAAKYQLLADMLPGKEVPGLKLRIPAIRLKMGPTHCYMFSVSPAYLLKICYVSHRSKGKASDVDTYQRMVNKSRLKKIREYISDDGYFPTSIVVNLENRRVQFDRIKQEGDDDGILGWLEIRPAYKSAWIIDGQHRLFGYSGHDRAAKARLSVLAFTGLKASEQAQLFIKINSQQKKVSQLLLQTMIAELNWDADSPQTRLAAIISKAVQVLDADRESVFFGRIQTSDETKDVRRCITITSLHSAIEKAKFHIEKEKRGSILDFGPLWAGDSDSTLKRTTFVLNAWFRLIQTSAPEWWELGSSPGGGLSMNDGVATCIAVLRSVFEHIEAHGKKLNHRDADDVAELVEKYGVALGDYLGSLSEQGRAQFRELRGVQGVTARTRRCQKAIRDKFPEFNPEGLERFLEEEKAQTNSRANDVIGRIETTLQKVVMEELRREFGDDEGGWWMEGVPKTVRLEVGRRYDDDDGKRGSKEHYFDLIHYRKIAMEHWEVFQELLGFGKRGAGKDKGTSWMNDLNEKRKVAAHRSAAISLNAEDLAQLQEYEKTLILKVSGRAGAESEGEALNESSEEPDE